MINNKFLSTIGAIISIMFFLLSLIIVIEDLSIRHFFVDPILTLVKKNPLFISYLLMFNIIIFGINQTWELIIKVNK